MVQYTTTPYYFDGKSGVRGGKSVSGVSSWLEGSDVGVGSPMDDEDDDSDSKAVPRLSSTTTTS